MDVLGDVINQLTHLGVVGTGVTVCGLTVGVAWGIRKFFWVGQVGRKDCRDRLAKENDHGSSEVKE